MHDNKELNSSSLSCASVTCNIETKEHDEEFDSSSLCPWGPLTLEQTKKWWWGTKFLVVVSLGFTTLERKKHNNKELSSLSSCTWLTYNTRTKEHDDKVLRSSSMCQWGPPTFEHKKEGQWGTWFLIIVSLGLVALETKDAQWWGAKLLVIVQFNDSQHWNKRAWRWKVVTVRLGALEQKLTCLNPKRKHKREKGSLPCSSVVLHACSKLLPLGALQALSLVSPRSSKALQP